MEIYVGNLPYTVDSEQLGDMFRPYGAVARADVKTDRESGQSKGFGFVTIDDDDDARSAIAALNGSTVGTRTIRVSPATGRKHPAQRRP